jgi:hypothetical protein
MDQGNLKQLLQKIINLETKYLRIYKGKVVDVNDSEKMGRILVQVPSLGWDDNEKAIWCNPSDKNSIITPKVDDWVRIGFSEGSIDRAYYFGCVNEIQNILPAEFDGNATTQIIFQDNNDEVFLKYDEQQKILQISDSHGNIITMDSNGIVIEDTNGNKNTMDSSGIKLEDANGNTIEMGTTSIKFNGTNAEILQ